MSFSQNRIKGFVDAHEKYRLKFDGKFIIETGLMISDGEREMEKLITSHNIPYALFAVNNPTAIGAITSLKKNGY